MTRGRMAWVLVVLTIVWGVNWPIMKLGVSGSPAHPETYPPLTFRALSMWLGLPVFALALKVMGIALTAPRPTWRPIFRLALTNMMVWHAIVIVAVQSLSSGRAAILGYSMPIFAALWGRLLYGDRLGGRQAMGVAAAGLGIVMLLAHEFSKLSGAPWAALAMLLAAATWALGTHELRRTTIELPLLTIGLWMMVLSGVMMALLAFVFESDRWRLPPPHTLGAIVYNAVGVFVFAQAAWFVVARHLPPVASSISVMLIPVLGTFSGAWWLGEPLHWQDFAAMVLMVVAIAAVLIKRTDR